MTDKKSTCHIDETSPSFTSFFVCLFAVVREECTGAGIDSGFCSIKIMILFKKCHSGRIVAGSERATTLFCKWRVSGDKTKMRCEAAST